MLILAAKLRIYTKYLDSSFSGKRCLSIRNHKPQTSYSGKRRDEMFRDEAYEMGSGHLWMDNCNQNRCDLQVWTNAFDQDNYYDYYQHIKMNYNITVCKYIFVLLWIIFVILFYSLIFMFRFAYGTTKAAVIGLTKEKNEKYMTYWQYKSA